MALPSPKPIQIPSYHGDTGETGVRRCEVFFQSVAEIDARIRDRCAVVDGALLTDHRTGAQFALRDAMRILGSAQGVDVFGMTGRIVALSELLSLGATLSATALRIGNVEY
ncbi:MAG: hypothetical protein CSA75_01595, partial [Sorangium cellulosum]